MSLMKSSNLAVELWLTLGVHAQRGLQYSVCVSVCLSVCASVTLRLFSHYRLRGGLSAIPTASVLQGHEK